MCRVTAIAAGAYHSMALTVGGAILAFGCNEHGALGLGDIHRCFKPTLVQLRDYRDDKPTCLRAVQLACGSRHTIALISNQGTLEVRSTGELTIVCCVLNCFTNF